jgi:hypothetical protein
MRQSGEQKMGEERTMEEWMGGSGEAEERVGRTQDTKKLYQEPQFCNM